MKFLSTIFLHCSQRQAQIRAVLESINCEAIIKEIREYKSSWRKIKSFQTEDLKERLEMEGVSSSISVPCADNP